MAKLTKRQQEIFSQLLKLRVQARAEYAALYEKMGPKAYGYWRKEYGIAPAAEAQEEIYRQLHKEGRHNDAEVLRKKLRDTTLAEEANVKANGSGARQRKRGVRSIAIFREDNPMPDAPGDRHSGAMDQARALRKSPWLRDMSKDFRSLSHASQMEVARTHRPILPNGKGALAAVEQAQAAYFAASPLIVAANEDGGELFVVAAAFSENAAKSKRELSLALSQVKATAKLRGDRVGKVECDDEGCMSVSVKVHGSAQANGSGARQRKRGVRSIAIFREDNPMPDAPGDRHSGAMDQARALRKSPWLRDMSKDFRSLSHASQMEVARTHRPALPNPPPFAEWSPVNSAWLTLHGDRMFHIGGECVFADKKALKAQLDRYGLRLGKNDRIEAAK